MTVPDESLTIERMRADIAKALSMEPADVADDANVVDLGLDSVRAMMLIRKWNRAGAALTIQELAEKPELGYWWSLVVRSGSNNSAG